MKQIATLMMMVFAIATYAQKADWGRLLEADNKKYSPVIVGEDEKAIYVVSLEDKEMRLEKYDSRKLSRKYSKLMDAPTKGRDTYSIERFDFLGEHFVFFGSHYDNKTKTYELSAFTYDANNGSREDSYEIFSEEVEKRRRMGDFDVHTSKGKERMLVHFTTYYRDTDISIEKIKLYNRDMDQLLEREYKYEGRTTGRLNNIIVDDEGSIYFIKEGAVVILDANKGFEEWSEPIVVDGMASNGYLNNFYFTLNSDQDLVLVSSYMTRDLRNTKENKNRKDRKRDDTQVEGVFFMKVNGFSKETEVATLSKFDREFLDQFLTEKDIRKGRDTEMNDKYNSFDFFFREDGGVVFVTEEAYSISYYRNNALTGQSFYYQDMVVFNFSPEGELEWANRIPKNQRFYWSSVALGFNQGSYGWSWWTVPMTYKGHFSYLAGLSDDKFYVVFNDNKKNIQKKNEAEEMTEMRKLKNAVPCVYAIDLETGIKTKDMDLSLVAANAYLKPSVNYQGSQDGALYIFGMKKKSYRYGKIEYSKAKKSARR